MVWYAYMTMVSTARLAKAHNNLKEKNRKNRVIPSRTPAPTPPATPSLLLIKYDLSLLLPLRHRAPSLAQAPVRRGLAPPARALGQAVEVLDRPRSLVVQVELVLRCRVNRSVLRGGERRGPGARERAVRPPPEVERVGVQQRREVELCRLISLPPKPITNKRATRAHLDEPASGDRARGIALLGLPQRLRGRGDLRVGHIVPVPRAVRDVDEVRLRGRVGGAAPVVRGVEPPREREEGGPGGREDVVGEEEVGEVERALGVFLCVGG